MTRPPPPLLDQDCRLAGQGPATAYAATLLADLGLNVQAIPGPEDEAPALTWNRSGLMALTGHNEGPPLLLPTALPSCVEGALLALGKLFGPGQPSPLPDARLLSERAALAGLTRQGAISAGGSCRLMEAADGWLALNLARDDDWALLPAWLDRNLSPDWSALAPIVGEIPLSDLLERGRLLGLALAPALLPESPHPRWFQRERLGPKRQGPLPTQPRVLDLGALWAGPLAGHLLQRAGAQVVKVESLQRPDGARRGPEAFYDLMNEGKASVALDFASSQGIEQLHRLIARADIVIEGSRPRALRQLGIDAERLVAETPGLTWISLTGYGRAEPEGQWIAYGDDAAVAAGTAALVAEVAGHPLFCGDALADPLTGLHAALAAWASFLGGGGHLLSLSLASVTRYCLSYDLPPTPEARQERHTQWQSMLTPPAGRLPAPRHAKHPARPLGADTVPLLKDWGIPC